MFVVSAQYPDINDSRPRVWVDSARFSELEYLITVPGEAQDTYDEFIYAYDNWWITDPELYLEGSDSTQWTWTWSSPYASDQYLMTVFIYKVTHDTLALKRCRFLAQQIINQIDTTDFSTMDWYEKEKLLRNMSSGDMMLDQCYTALPDVLRDQLAQSLYQMNREFMNTFILSSSGNSYVSSHNTWNNIFCNQNALALYNSAGLSEAQKDTVVQWYETIYDKHINGFIPCWTHYRDDDGGWNWGAAYAMWSLVDQFQLFENMKIGTDKDFYTDLPWVQNSINQYVYFIQPNNTCIHLGDGQTSLWADRVMYLHARYYHDPRSQWMVQCWSQPEMMTWTGPKFNKLLYKDFTMPVVEQPELPLDWWADKVGLSVSRSSWEEDATMVTFFNSPSKRAAHEHRDNNSFTIFKNAPLLLDAGYYDSYNSSHYRNYYQRTIAHNSICVFDSLDSYSCFGQEASNDGGQIESSALMNYNEIFLPQNQRGDWIHYGTGDHYSYNIADAQLSYDTAKLDFFRRKLLYMKPGKVIVLDYVHIKNTSNSQREIKWIAHFANKPLISGSLVNTEVFGHIESFDGNSYAATNGNGSVAIKTLIPQNSKVTRIGGEGFEFWVNVVNYPPDAEAEELYPSTGSWRIEVKPATISDTVIYLHAICVGDSLNVAEAGGISFQNSYSVGADWDDTLYFFSADADTGKVYHFTDEILGGRTITVFATDLRIGIYDVLVDGVISVTAATDESGVFQSTVDLIGGGHAIELVPTSTGIKQLNEIGELRVYPNPARTEIHLDLPQPDPVEELVIYNLNGEVILRGDNQESIDVSRLSIGIYMIQVRQLGVYHVARFIKK